MNLIIMLNVVGLGKKLVKQVVHHIIMSVLSCFVLILTAIKEGTGIFSHA